MALALGLGLGHRLDVVTWTRTLDLVGALGLIYLDWDLAGTCTGTKIYWSSQNIHSLGTCLAQTKVALGVKTLLNTRLG